MGIAGVIVRAVIVQQNMVASDSYKMLHSMRNAYAMGKVRMVASEFKTATRVMKILVA